MPRHLVVLTELFRCERLSATITREVCAKRREIAAKRKTAANLGCSFGMALPVMSHANVRRGGGTTSVAVACYRCEIGDAHLEALRAARLAPFSTDKGPMKGPVCGRGEARLERPLGATQKTRNQRTPREK